MSISLKAIIIDDEPLARDDLRGMLAKYPFVKIAGEAADIKESAALLSKTRVDVVFLDVQLRGGSGFDLVPLIPSSAEIVFFTAYDEYAIRAFEVNALDYLLKPVTEERLGASLRRLKDCFRNKVSPSDTLMSLRPDDRMFIKTDTERCFIPVDAISAVTALGGNYTVVHLAGGKRHVVRRTLKDWNSILPRFPFRQIHRSTIVNANRIERVGRDTSGSCLVSAAGIDYPLKVSRRAAPLLKGLIAGTK
ncbi:MAG: LytTR family DNA-binding domain-containing protein [Syntrophales bacterium]|nr:LytTR family DNA-binding domain-containing protein [Syntrophales bacterium]